MGRLVDDVLAMFGVKPSDRVVNTKPLFDLFPFREDSGQGDQEELSESGVPVKKTPKDCVSCRVIGTSAMTSLGLYTVYATYRNRVRYTGRKQKAHMFAGASLAASFFWLGLCRAFDMGLFAEREPDETLGSALTKEVEAISRYKAEFFKSKDNKS